MGATLALSTLSSMGKREDVSAGAVFNCLLELRIGGRLPASNAFGLLLGLVTGGRSTRGTVGDFDCLPPTECPFELRRPERLSVLKLEALSDLLLIFFSI